MSSIKYEIQEHQGYEGWITLETGFDCESYARIAYGVTCSNPSILGPLRLIITLSSILDSRA